MKEEVKELIDSIENRLIISQEINEPINPDLDKAIKLSVAYEELQEKVNQLEEKIKTYEDPEDMTLMYMWCDEKAKDKIKQLETVRDNAIALIDLELLKRQSNINFLTLIQLKTLLKGSDK